MPQHTHICYQFPENPLLSLLPLGPCPPVFSPGKWLTVERLANLGILDNEFLCLEEHNLVTHVLYSDEIVMTWDETEKGRFQDEYFDSVVIPMIKHIQWMHHQPQVPPSIHEEVIKVIKSKIMSSVYKLSNSPYQLHWFCIVKKNGAIQIMYDL